MTDRNDTLSVAANGDDASAAADFETADFERATDEGGVLT